MVKLDRKEIDLIVFYLKQTLMKEDCFKRDYGAIVDLCKKLEESR